ncbi:MAG TPA: hypothetical protein VIG46_10400 [Candidatus Baltobacteraceae bacterium]|jgi:hypothetical protein
MYPIVRRLAVAIALAIASVSPAARAAAPTSVWLAFQHMNVHQVQTGCRLEGAGVVSCGKAVGSASTSYTGSTPATGAADGICLVEVRLKKNPPENGSPFSVSAMWSGKVRCAVTWTNESSVSVTFTRT